MRDLDFDELDKAVKAVMSDSGIIDDTSSPINVNSTNSSRSNNVHKGPLVGGSKESFKPKKRNRLFMDMKPSSNKDNSSSDVLLGSTSESEIKERAAPKKDFNSRNFEFTYVEAKVDSTPAPVEKAPFVDAFASLQNEVEALGIESDVVNVNHRAPSTKPVEKTPTPEVSKSQEVKTVSKETPAPEEEIDEDVSFSPFLSSVSIDKRPLGGYGGDTPKDPPAAETKVGDIKSESAKAKSANDFYGLDPLADMTIEDIDATIVSPEGVNSTPDVSSNKKTDSTEQTIDELGSRIEHELNGESSDDLNKDGSKAELVKTGDEKSDSKEDSFHKEAPIFQETEVIADFDAEFAELEVEGEEEKTLPAAMTAPIAVNAAKKVELEEPADIPEEKKLPEEDSEAELETPEEEPEELTKEEILGKMTVSPGDDSVSVEQVAAMEESFAAQTEGPQEQANKKSLLKKVKIGAERPTREADKSQDKPAILREGGPGSITPQYRTSSKSTKPDKAEHGTFNPESFAMPVGNTVKPVKKISPVVMAVVAVLAVIVGASSAFALFHSGLI